MSNSNINEKLGYYKFFYIFLPSTKMRRITIRDDILDRANECYKNNKEVLREKEKNKHRELSEEKNIARESERNR